MNMLGDFHFLRPWWLLALAILPLAWFAWRHVRSEAGNWSGIVDAHLLVHLIDSTQERARNGGVWLAATIWFLASIAMAGPAWERDALPLYRSGAARVLAIELAPTMLAADVKPTRLERARYKLNDILTASRDMQTALIGYSGDAFVAAPLTDDVNTVRNLIDSLDPGVMPVVGNATERAIAEAERLIAQAGLKRGELILLADSTSSGALAAARAAHARGLSISVLGIGSSAGAPVPLPQGGFLQDATGNIVLPRLDESSLRALAEAGGGRYATLTTERDDIESLLSIDHAGSDATLAAGDRALSERFLDRGAWFVLLLLPLALVAFRRGWLMVLAVALLAPAPPAQAFEFIDLWQRPDQQAMQALAKGDAARAQELARDPALRGSAAYRAEDFGAATDAFAQAPGADATYNQGNALAKEGKYAEAIEAYERALAVDPAMEDAHSNKQAVEEWLKRQQSEPNKNQQGDKNDKDQEKDKSEQKDNPGEQKSEQQQNQQNEQRQQDQQDQQGKSEQDKQSSSQGDSKEQKDSKSDASAEPDTSGADHKSAAEAAQDQQTRAQQQENLSKEIDQALQDKQEGEPVQAPVVSAEEAAASEQKQALNQWLQRVPDDPGGLLRRKFQLEYERRQRDGGGG